MLLFEREKERKERGDFRPVGAIRPKVTKPNRRLPGRGPAMFNKSKNRQPSPFSSTTDGRRGTTEDSVIMVEERVDLIGHGVGRTPGSRVGTGRIHEVVPDFPFHPFGPRALA